VSRIKCLIDYYKDLPEVKRLKELEPYYDNNKDITRILDEMDNLNKKMKISYVEENYLDYKKYKDEYHNKYQELLDIPFVEEFKELMDIIYNMLDTTSKIIENELKKKLK
jgi:cell fate (sporulation/competence/biofilm development) regulator YmcA (YheA/YmcA/DUF963 family)